MDRRELYLRVLECLDRDNQHASRQSILTVADCLLVWHSAMQAVRDKPEVFDEKKGVWITNPKLRDVERMQKVFESKQLKEINTGAAVAELELAAGMEELNAINREFDVEQGRGQEDPGGVHPADLPDPDDAGGGSGESDAQDLGGGHPLDRPLEQPDPGKGRRPRRSKIPAHLRVRPDAGDDGAGVD